MKKEYTGVQYTLTEDEAKAIIEDLNGATNLCLISTDFIELVEEVEEEEIEEEIESEIEVEKEVEDDQENED